MQLTFKNITVLGSGIMGHGIAQVAATAGCKVALRDIKDEFLDNAMQKIRWSLDKMAKKGRITPEDADRIYERITPYTDLSEALKGCEMVIEAVPEIMDLKKKVYAELESSAPENAVFASNTSTLPITEIAGTITRPERFVGIHFFNSTDEACRDHTMGEKKTGSFTPRTLFQRILQILQPLWSPLNQSFPLV